MMTVSRSHDLIWGAYGANASHFGVLQQYLAARLGLGVGTYTMISNNAHMYLETMPPRKLGQPRVLSHPSHNLYADGKVNVFPIFSGWENEDDYRREINLQQDLAMLFEYPLQETQLKARWPWLRQVVCPMLLAHQHWRQGRGEDRYTGALEILSQVKASDWSQAGEQWLQRRYDKWKRAADDGALHDD